MPQFIDKNCIPENAIKESDLLSTLLKINNKDIIYKDDNGHYHFNSDFNNNEPLIEALDRIEQTELDEYVKCDRENILAIYEDVFHHDEFTGRSGTFFGYEGLGSIYWHMVSKLRLAVYENYKWAESNRVAEAQLKELKNHYYDIESGLGNNKEPADYGAFPMDPYSHTPAHRGAQQPGMTGQVKEDILSRFGELGVFVSEGKLHFKPCLLRKDEFLHQPITFEYLDVHSKHQQLQLEAGSLGFTYCQVPVIYQLAPKN